MMLCLRNEKLEALSLLPSMSISDVVELPSSSSSIPAGSSVNFGDRGARCQLAFGSLRNQVVTQIAQERQNSTTQTR